MVGEIGINWPCCSWVPMYFPCRISTLTSPGATWTWSWLTPQLFYFCHGLKTDGYSLACTTVPMRCCMGIVTPVLPVWGRWCWSMITLWRSWQRSLGLTRRLWVKLSSLCTSSSSGGPRGLSSGAVPSFWVSSAAPQPWLTLPIQTQYVPFSGQWWHSLCQGHLCRECFFQEISSLRVL